MKRILNHVHGGVVNTEPPTKINLARHYPKHTSQSIFIAESAKLNPQFEFLADHKVKNDAINFFSPKQKLCQNPYDDLNLEHSLKDDSGLHFSAVQDLHVDSNEKLEITHKDTKQIQIESIANQVKNENNEDPKQDLIVTNFKFKFIRQENLNLRYAKVFSRTMCDNVFKRLEKEIEYFSGDLLKVRVFGKWHDIPRKQVAFGEEGLSYAFSGNLLPSKPWSTCSIILQLKDSVESITGESFNFVLVNRYANGSDHMGEHRDDEKELVSKAPIASLSFGEVRQFIFKHKDSRGKNSKRNIPPLKMELESGSLLLMDYPTNKFWYHSLPVRKNASNVRINLTFRKMISQS